MLVPIGSTEQHGPHLPLGTDTVIATAVAERAAEQMRSATGAAPVVIAPALAYGASGEHQEFPGTSSIGHDALRAIVVELTRSICTWAARVVLVNGHGGNSRTLEDVVVALRAEGRDVIWVPCAVEGGDAHAGRTETSLMLHLAPGSVHLGSAARGNVTPIRALLDDLRSGGTRRVAPNGVLGDPTEASDAEGARLLDEMTAGVLDRMSAAP